MNSCFFKTAKFSAGREAGGVKMGRCQLQAVKSRCRLSSGHGSRRAENWEREEAQLFRLGLFLFGGSPIPVESLRRFSNSREVLRGVQCGFFLMKTPLSGCGSALHQLENRYGSSNVAFTSTPASNNRLLGTPECHPSDKDLSPGTPEGKTPLDRIGCALHQLENR